MDTTITFISDCGYWNLSRTAGTSNITPKFAYDSTHCDYLTVKPVHITLWDGTKWTDKGEGVNDSNTKKTSAAVTLYGNFALAYKLMPGDAPQFPYELTLGTTCTAAELLFDTKDKWFAFSPDSAVVKIGLFNSDPLKLYAAIQSATIYEAYIVGDTLNFVNDWHWNCDSALYAAQLFATELTPSTSYLMKVSKYDTSGCAGIYDTTKYYLNVCLLNLRTNPNTEVCLYDDALSLLGCLGNGTATYMGSAVGVILWPH
ncbi:MAG: hypothetical protein IPP71_09180 [Bacteroidetes bacterium]|nr:hypothetical protein [Bacteroidota bacterium]